VKPLDYVLSRIDDSGQVPYEVGTVKALANRYRHMSDPVLPGVPPVPVILRRSARARRISLRVSRLDGRVTLTLPHGVAETEAMAFAHSKQDWIRGLLENRPSDAQIDVGSVIPVEGRDRQVVCGTSRAVRLTDDEIAVPAANAGRRVQSFLKELARDRLAGASDHYAAMLGRSYARITLRDTRSRWGSCSSSGGLMYSWRLIMAPPEILTYVAAHEVAHLAQMNHSPAFWATVAQLYGPYETSRGWLRTQGNSLHRYRFDGATRSA